MTEAHTAWQNQDYLDEPGYHGNERFNDHDKMVELLVEANKEGFTIHVHSEGGGFQSGGSSDPLYSGTNIATTHDVLVVNFNYRVNVFGFVNFASLDSSFEDSGYLGIKDQVAVLQWVKENISNFGGDPDNITIFGESAGAISCMLQAVIPESKGLFDKAIPQSAISYMYNTLEHSAEVATAYMKFGGAKTMNDMMKKSSAELVALYEKVKENRLAETAGDYLSTCDGKFIPSNPFKALNDGGARGIKMLTGTTADEWRYWLMYMDNFFEMFRADPKKRTTCTISKKAKGT